MEENKIPERVSYINLGTTGLRGRQRNRSQVGMREDGRVAGKSTQQRGMEEALENGKESSNSAPQGRIKLFGAPRQ